MVFIRFPFNYHLKYLDFGEGYINTNLLRSTISLHLESEDFTLFCDGKQLYHDEKVSNNASVYVTFPLPGGKGGFGSMLRAIGAQIEKTTNREACRDLSGRRLRDINEEQRIKKWLAKEAEREAEKIKRRQARIERLKSKPKHQFNDFEFQKEVSSNRDRVDDALSEGLKKVKSIKKDSVEKIPSKKRAAQWLKDEIADSGTSDSDDSSISENSNEGSMKKQKLDIDDSSSSHSEMLISSENSNSNFSQVRTGETPEVPSQSCSFYESQKIGISKEGSNSVQSEANENNVTSHSTEKPHIVLEDTRSELSRSSGDISDNKNDNTQETENVETTTVEEKTRTSTDMNVEDAKKTLSDVDLLNYQNMSELEALGLEQLKFFLLCRGLKCGGTLTDRAQRLWRVRGLKPHEYPANLLAKKK